MPCARLRGRVGAGHVSNGRVAGSVRAAPLGLERAGGGARRRRMGGWLGRGPSMALDRWPPRRHSFPIRRGL